jgi:hypothetical protein
MSRVSRFTLRAAVGPLALLAACSGDDGSAPGSDAGSDAPTTLDGGDATMPGSDASTDAPVDVASDASPPDVGPPVTCAWKNAAPMLVADLGADGGTGTFNGDLWVGEPTAGDVRIIGQPSHGPAFRVYGFARGDSSATALDGPVIAGAAFERADHFALASGGVVEVLVQTDSADGGATELAAYLVPDSMPKTGPVPSPIGLSPGGFAMAAFPIDGATIFDAVTYLASASPTSYYALGVGRATSSAPSPLATLSESPNADDLLGLALAHAAGNVYVFASNGASLHGESVWTVPDTASVPSPLTARAFESGTIGRIIAIAPAATTGSTNIAYYSSSLDFQVQGVRAGQIADTSLATVTAADLALARNYGTPWLVTAGHSAEWSGDDLLLVGPGQEEDGGVVGMNALWVDAYGNVRAEMVGATALSPERRPPRAATASRASATSWDVAWIEVNGAAEALFYDELACP